MRDIAGNGGIEYWRFKAKAEGTDTLSFEYRRPLEDDSKAQKQQYIILVTK